MPWLLQSRAWLSQARCLLERATGTARRARQHRSEFYADLWREAAAAIGATAEEHGSELFRISRGQQATWVYRNYTDLDGPVTLRAAGNKPLVHAELSRTGIPTPKHLPFRLNCLHSAEIFLAAHGQCVVKPAAGTGAGQGVTTGVTNRRQLVRAALAAAAYGADLLIEQQVAGHNVRMLYLDGELLDAVLRQPPTVMGDGRASIGTLVARINEQRLAAGYRQAQVILRHDSDMRNTLARQQLSWRAIPAAGRRVTLKTVINDNAAEENVSVSDRLHPKTIEMGRRAAAALGVRLAGVDVVIEDITADLATSGVVLEINTTPGLYIHYANRSARVAEPILEACLADQPDRLAFEREPLSRRIAREAAACR